MTPKYWIKIVAGMLVVFAIGAFAVRGVHRGESFLASNSAISVPLLSAPFRLDGARLGALRRLRIERSAPKEVSGFALTVKLDDSTTLDRLGHCQLAILDANHIDNHTTFTCVDAADTSLALVPFGSVIFQPGDHEQSLLVPRSFAADLSHDLAAGMQDDGAVDSSSDNGGHLRISVNGKDLVNISGDSAGGSVVVRDAQGNPIVDISGDSNGGRIRVNDAQGNTKVNIQAPAKKKPPTP